MRILVLLALIAPSAAYAADDDPDAFAVPTAAPLQVLPIAPISPPPDPPAGSAPETRDAAETDPEGNPVEPAARGKFAAPEAKPAPAEPTTDASQPLALPAFPTETVSEPAAPVAASPASPAPAAPAPTVEAEAPPAVPAIASTPEPRAPEVAPAPPPVTAAPPPVTAAPPEPIPETGHGLDGWSERTSTKLKKSARKVQIWWDRTFHGLEPAEEAPPPRPGTSDDIPPFHAAAPTPAQSAPMAIPAETPPPPSPPTEGASSGRPLAIPGGSPPPPESWTAADAPPAQREAQSRPEPEPESEVEEQERMAGIWGGVHGAATSVDGSRASTQGFDLGFHIDQRFVLSGTVGTVDARNGSLAVGFVGIRPGWVFAPRSTVHPRVDLLWAVGAETEAANRPFNLAEPRVGLEVSLKDWGRLEATVGHRFITPQHPRSSQLSGFTAGVGIRLGWF